MERRKPRRTDVRLPWDESAERGAIGALLLAPRVHAVKLARRAWQDHFYDNAHGWLWARLTFAITQRHSDFDSKTDLQWWLAREKILPNLQRLGTGSGLVVRCLNEGFWWHGHWYIDRVLMVAKARARIVSASERLSEALEAGERWWA